MARPIRVGISHGDINGVSYEIILKALGEEGFTDLCTPVIFGTSKLISFYRKALGINDFYFRQVASADAVSDGEINVVNVSNDEMKITPGVPSAEGGAAALVSLEKATEALLNGDIDVLVTAPIDKNTIQNDSFRFSGHTEYLQAKAGDGAKSLMILFDDHIRVALVTTHLPIAEVPTAISKERIVEVVKMFDRSLRADFACERPKIAVLSLNPHCGDHGLLGKEEQETIIPAIEECVAEGILAFGPYSADGFFASGSYAAFDGVVAMYHDQGLAPFKALAQGNGVNFTAGLPFVRTSPDHGTAYDIAGKGVADPTSMREAVYKAIDIFRRRRAFERASANPLRKQTDMKKTEKSKDKEKAPKDAAHKDAPKVEAKEQSAAADKGPTESGQPAAPSSGQTTLNTEP